ncbi:hypothetical protein [Rhizobium sullae]|uniref:hypothetical protein n=1 Tax=Rhizobium sullae TaxID=50338 RepID=UPI0012FDAB1B|nr:hypothetical protein [Rhizobium sullae]
MISQRQAAEDAGLSKDQQVQAVRVANVPAEEFERQVESDAPPTIAKLATLFGEVLIDASLGESRSVLGVFNTPRGPFALAPGRQSNSGLLRLSHLIKPPRRPHPNFSGVGWMRSITGVFDTPVILYADISGGWRRSRMVPSGTFAAASGNLASLSAETTRVSHLPALWANLPRLLLGTIFRDGHSIDI